VTLHISFGGAAEYARLPRLAKSSGSTLWTLARGAKQDDTVIMYIKSPVASFVAAGRVMNDRRSDGAKHGWPGQVMGRVGDFAMLDQAVPLRVAAARVPGWGYLRQPHRNTTVPQEYEQGFLKAIGSPAAPRSDPTVLALENLQREAVTLSRSRNRGLRDAVIAQSNGVCAACAIDYSAIEAQWRSLLQAHHLKPLHELENPVVNEVNDLAALCPTCHTLAHLRPGKARTARQVKSLLDRRAAL
jgi:hypothetical protein